MSAEPAPDRLTREGRLLFAVLLLLGIALRLYHLGTPSLWWDEANTMNHTHTTETPARLLDTHYSDQAFLYHVVIYCWDRLLVDGFGMTDPASYWKDFGLRMFPALAGIAALPLAFLLTRRLTRSNAMALGALFVFAVSPFQIYYAQELRVYSLEVLLALGAAYCMARALQEDRWPWWLGMTLCTALMLYGHYIAVLYIFCFNVAYVLTLPRTWRLLPKWTAWNGIMMILVTPALYHLVLVNQTIHDWEFQWYPHPNLRTLYITYKNFFAGFGFQPGAYRPLLALAFALMACAAWALRRKPLALLLLGVMAFGPVLMNWQIWRMREFPMYEDRTMIMSAAFAALLAGAGIGALPRPGLRVVAALAFAALTAPNLWDYYRGVLHPVREHRIAICDKADFRTATHFLQQNWQEGDLLAHDSLFTAFPMRYYFQGPQLHLGPTPLDAVIYARAFGYVHLLKHLGVLPVLAKDAVRGHERVWLIEGFGVTADDQPQSEPVYDWLERHFARVESHEFDGVRLHLFVQRETP
jgi:hypothetical protein